MDVYDCGLFLPATLATIQRQKQVRRIPQWKNNSQLATGPPKNPCYALQIKKP
jgi:hypothetical protein